MILIILGVLYVLLGPSPLFAGQTIEEKIEALQRQVNELKAQLEAQQTAMKQASHDREAEARPMMPGSPEVSFGGQYRVNFYNADNDTNNVNPDIDDQRAARVRIRQNIDFTFSNQFKTHLQLELQNTTDNVTTTDVRLRGASTNVSVRHAVMDYTFGNGVNLQAGIVPLHDYFHDALFSSDWDYNPVAVSVILPVWEGSLRAFAADLSEGAENITQDDFVHYQADYTLPFEGNEVVLSATVLNLQEDPSVGIDDAWHYNFGISGRFSLSNRWRLNGFIIGSDTDRELLGATHDADGVAVLAELVGSLGRGNFGVLVSYASGDEDGTGFLPPMAFPGTFGYWGYTGVLTVQGPTDTGFDFDGTNISNNGLGMTTVQAKYSIPINDKLTGYLAGGWFGNTDAPTGRDDTLGLDFLAMGIYRFTPVFEFDFGFAYALLNDSVSGYFQGVQNGGAGLQFNQDAGVERDKWALFGRLQAEF